MRRPLRFLAHKLDLDQKQIAELARILDELKIERAQADVDNLRKRGSSMASPQQQRLLRYYILIVPERTSGGL